MKIEIGFSIMRNYAKKKLFGAKKEFLFQFRTPRHRRANEWNEDKSEIWEKIPNPL